MAYPMIGSLPISKITPQEVLAVLRKVEATGRYETARRMRSVLSRVFRYGIATARADRDVAADPGVDQSVSLNIDGLQVSQGSAYSIGTFDMAQVKVLRGPQALFFGKASSGGVISIRTADPGDQVEVIGRLGYLIVRSGDPRRCAKVRRAGPRAAVTRSHRTRLVERAHKLFRRPVQVFSLTKSQSFLGRRDAALTNLQTLGARSKQLPNGISHAAADPGLRRAPASARALPHQAGGKRQGAVPRLRSGSTPSRSGSR